MKVWPGNSGLVGINVGAVNAIHPNEHVGTQQEPNGVVLVEGLVDSDEGDEVSWYVKLSFE